MKIRVDAMVTMRRSFEKRWTEVQSTCSQREQVSVCRIQSARLHTFAFWKLFLNCTVHLRCDGLVELAFVRQLWFWENDISLNYLVWEPGRRVDYVEVYGLALLLWCTRQPSSLCEYFRGPQ